jgi:hypothetical protein
MIKSKINITQKPGSDPEEFKQQSDKIRAKLTGMLQNMQGEAYKKLIDDFFKKTGFYPAGIEHIKNEIASLESCSQSKRERTVMMLLITTVVNYVTQQTGQTNEELLEEISPGSTKYKYAERREALFQLCYKDFFVPLNDGVHAAIECFELRLGQRRGYLDRCRGVRLAERIKLAKLVGFCFANRLVDRNPWHVIQELQLGRVGRA